MANEDRYTKVETEMLTCLKALETKVDSLNKNTQKTVFALIGVIAATIGVKFMGSPWYSILFTYTALFAGAFCLAGTIFEWKKLYPLAIVVRLLFLTFLFFSVTCRTFIFEATQGVPSWFTPIVDIFYILLSVFFVLSIVKHPDNKTDKKCGD